MIVLLQNLQDSFPLNSSKTSRPFELLHINLWGKYNTPTYQGYPYFLPFVDDFSRVTWILLMTNKRNSLHLFKTFIIQAMNQFDTTIKLVHSDNGMEFLSKDFLLLLDQFGITHQLSCPHTP